MTGRGGWNKSDPVIRWRFYITTNRKIFLNQENALFISVFLYRKKILRQIEQLKDVDIIEVAEYGAGALLFVKVPCTGCYPPSYTNFA